MKIRAAKEITGSNILALSKSAGPYNSKKRQGNRFTERTTILSIPYGAEWQKQDVNKLFNTGNYLFSIPVQGKTNRYVVQIEIIKFLPLLNEYIRMGGFTTEAIAAAIIVGTTSNDVKIHCTCPDFKHRFHFWVTQSGSNAGVPQSIVSSTTNPTDSLGKGCKHILYCLSDKSWARTIAKNLFDYLLEVYATNPDLFEKMVSSHLSVSSDDVLKAMGKTVPPKSSVAEAVEGDVVHTSTDSYSDSVSPQAMPQEDSSNEAFNYSYYEEANMYDDIQTMMLQIANDSQVDITKYVTPQNSPEQMGELIEVLKMFNLSEDIVRKLANPKLPFLNIRLLAKAKTKNIDLFNFSDYSSDALSKLFCLYEKGIDIRKGREPDYKISYEEIQRLYEKNVSNKISK